LLTPDIHSAIEFVVYMQGRCYS